jgi:uncharacterized protein YcbK (DUF882 family)
VIPSPIPVPASHDQVCKLADKWLICPTLASRLCALAQVVHFRLSIISGYRTREHQIRLREEGKPAAHPDLSTHCSCPATGADLRLDGIEPGPYEKALLGEGCLKVGLRWGGGSPAPDGIPVDWNHVDLGPRRLNQ